MKMIMTVIAKKNAEAVISVLVNNGFMATYGETRGGMLRQSQVSIYVAVEDTQVDQVLEIIQNNCKSRTTAINVSGGREATVRTDADSFELGGAVTFVWSLDRLEKC